MTNRFEQKTIILIRGDLVHFWHPKKGGWHLGRITLIHRDGKVRVRRLHKREVFSLDPAKLTKYDGMNPTTWGMPSESHRSPQRPVTRKR